MEKNARIMVAGADTITGMALQQQLGFQGYGNVVGGQVDASVLTDASQVDRLFAETSPEFVFLAAGESGGISANMEKPASLMLNNLLVTTNIINSAYHHGVKKLLNLASSCCYPRDCPQPMRVEHLMTGPLEPTNEAYATAKIAGIKLCSAYKQQHGANFVSAIPANPFGPGDDFSLEDSHVIGALVRKTHDAKINGIPSVEVWGSGKARREFIHTADLADACIFIMENYDGSDPINAGSGTAMSIRELAESIKDVVAYSGELRFDTSKPEGMPLKSLDSSVLLEMEWKPKESFQSRLAETYKWFLEQPQERTKGAIVGAQ